MSNNIRLAGDNARAMQCYAVQYIAMQLIVILIECRAVGFCVHFHQMFWILGTLAENILSFSKSLAIMSFHPMIGDKTEKRN